MDQCHHRIRGQTKQHTALRIIHAATAHNIILRGVYVTDHQPDQGPCGSARYHRCHHKIWRVDGVLATDVTQDLTAIEHQGDEVRNDCALP